MGQYDGRRRRQAGGESGDGDRRTGPGRSRSAPAAASTSAGTFNPTGWFGPHPKNLSQEFFDAAVENARKIIDAVKPRRAKFCYEMMGWALPDSPDAYLKLHQGRRSPRLWRSPRPVQHHQFARPVLPTTPIC